MNYGANPGEAREKPRPKAKQIQMLWPDQDQIKSCHPEKENITTINALQSNKQIPVWFWPAAPRNWRKGSWSVCNI